MILGKRTRELLVLAAKADDWIAVTDLTKSASRRNAIRETLQRLEGLKLVEVEKRIVRFTCPAVPRVLFRLSPLGREFVEVYSSPLVGGGRIRCKKFRDLTGRALPGSLEGRGAWLAPWANRGKGGPRGAEGAAA